MSIDEIESLFGAPVMVGPDPYEQEERFRAVGQTAVGRSAFVVFTWRIVGGKRLLRPLSARYMHQKEIDTYEEEIPKF